MSGLLMPGKKEAGCWGERQWELGDLVPHSGSMLRPAVDSFSASVSTSVRRPCPSLPFQLA